jgi:hypothetical protein
MSAMLDKELKSLLSYFGEDPTSPEAPKPEDLFGLIASFSSSLQVGSFRVMECLCLHLTNALI